MEGSVTELYRILLILKSHGVFANHSSFRVTKTAIIASYPGGEL